MGLLILVCLGLAYGWIKTIYIAKEAETQGWSDGFAAGQQIGHAAGVIDGLNRAKDFFDETSKRLNIIRDYTDHMNAHHGTEYSDEEVVAILNDKRDDEILSLHRQLHAPMMVANVRGEDVDGYHKETDLSK